MDRLKLLLTKIPAWKSIYEPTFVLPDRFRYLHPDAYNSIAQIADRLIFSDVFRLPEDSLKARQRKRGVQRPGFSAHNFGLAVDLDVDGTMKLNNFRSKKQLDDLMLLYNWQCYRKDNRKSASEAWHYTYEAKGPGSTEVEKVIDRYYGNFWYKTDKLLVQEILKEQGYYKGDIDGFFGPKTKEAVKKFQTKWQLVVDGIVGHITYRTMIISSASVSLFDPTNKESTPDINNFSVAINPFWALVQRLFSWVKPKSEHQENKKS